jgi:L-ascorbate metabolism protein UlaG (beta-lactamase superfamily)
MRKILKAIGTALLFAAVAICLAPTVVPPFLDRIYYRGPAGSHYDGERFFNPGPAPEAGSHGGPTRFLNRMLGGDDRAVWPAQVPVRQTRPPPRVAGDGMLVTWVGHATVLVQAAGLNILTDPIWSERPSPISFVGPRRARAPGIAFRHLPKIDLVLISHNHYDHMDLPTLKRLWQRDRPLIVTSLGNDTILKKQGIDALAMDWGGRRRIGPAEVVVERNHHWSSRWGTDRNRALWSAFTVRLPGGNLFFAGDTGWGDGRWVEEAARNGPYRLALIPIGAYEPRDFMKTNHINPEEAVRIFETLRPELALGVHWGTFQLTFEAIDDPPRRLAALKRARGIPEGRFVAAEAGQSFSVLPVRAAAGPAVAR